MITIQEAIKRFNVARSTLAHATNNGKLKNVNRKGGSVKRAGRVFIDEVELEAAIARGRIPQRNPKFAAGRAAAKTKGGVKHYYKHRISKELVLEIGRTFNKTQTAKALGRKYGVPSYTIYDLARKLRKAGIPVGEYRKTTSNEFKDALEILKRENGGKSVQEENSAALGNAIDELKSDSAQKVPVAPYHSMNRFG